MKKITPATKIHAFRLLGLVAFFFGLLGLLIWRMVALTITDSSFLKGQGDARSVRIQNIPANRGMITDRNGVVLAVSTPVESLFINPKGFEASTVQLTKLAHLVEFPVKKLAQKIKNAHDREFLYIKRQLPPVVADKIKKLNINGLNFQQEYKRFYPQAETTAQVVGFTNIDDVGIEGIELAYQDWLGGMPGKKSVLKDRTGKIVEELALIKPEHKGKDIALSIDCRLQYFAYQELKNTIEKFKAKSGSVVILDSKTGEILTVVNYPSFNPNARERFAKANYRNKAITDTFEPGSVIKPFSIASALATGRFNEHTIIDTRPSWMTVFGHTIRDGHNYGILDVQGVLKWSSNVGVSKMILQSPPAQLINVLTNAGFGQRTESGYPGESDGAIVKIPDANPFVLATLSFGYGLSVSALQLAKAYLSFADLGKIMPVSLLVNDNSKKAYPIIKAQTAAKVLAMMEAVLEEGTGKAARVPGYRVAGKTGTARIAGKKGYAAFRHIASFVGIAPITSPRLVTVVIIHEPTKNGYYGAQVAAPLFSKIMSYALRTLDVPPDQPIKEMVNAAS